jgi:hypothetical protein
MFGMKMKILYDDGQWLVGNRNWWTWNDETPGTHHYKVIDACRELKEYIGQEVAIPVQKPRLFILNYKDSPKQSIYKEVSELK